MRLRSLVTATVSALPLAIMTASSALAQDAPVVTEPPGLCAPWHRCVGYGVMAMAVLYVGFLGLNYMIQRKGFDKLEHRQGSPDGVPTNK